MPIIPNPTYETTPRDDLTIDIMLLIEDAIDGDEDVDPWKLAKRIVDLVDPTPLDPPEAVGSSTGAPSPVLMALVKASRPKYAP